MNSIQTKEEYDKWFIENKLLPQIRSLTSHLAYKSYDSFTSTPGTCYQSGENPVDYWNRVWLNHKLNPKKFTAPQGYGQ